MTSALERFEDKYQPEPNSGCFIWLAAISASGYGRIFFEGKNERANRVSWKLHRGEPGELYVLHRCDNPLCVNPDHLFLGTHEDNCLDKSRKGRVPNAKLDPQKVRDIRRMRREGRSLLQIASRFSVNQRTILSVVNRENWNHVA